MFITVFTNKTLTQNIVIVTKEDNNIPMFAIFVSFSLVFV